MHLREPGFNYSTCGLFKRMFVDLFPHYYKTLALEKKVWSKHFSRYPTMSIKYGVQVSWKYLSYFFGCGIIETKLFLFLKKALVVNVELFFKE